MNMEFKNLLSCIPKQQITECYKYRKPAHNFKKDTEIHMNKVELEAINNIVNPPLEPIEEEGGVQKLRNQQKGKPSDVVAGRLNKAGGKLEPNKAEKESKPEDESRTETPGKRRDLSKDIREHVKGLKPQEAEEALVSTISFLHHAASAIQKGAPINDIRQMSNYISNPPSERGAVPEIAIEACKTFLDSFAKKSNIKI